MVDDDNNHSMEYYCLLILNSTAGTVISLDKFLQDKNCNIMKFQQVGTV